MTPWALKLQLRSFRLDSSQLPAKLLHNMNNLCPVGARCTDHLLKNTAEDMHFLPIIKENVKVPCDKHGDHWISCNAPDYYSEHNTTWFLFTICCFHRFKMEQNKRTPSHNTAALIAEYCGQPGRHTELPVAIWWWSWGTRGIHTASVVLWLHN